MKCFSYDNAGTSSRVAPYKPYTRSDTIACKMLENVLCDVDQPWDQAIPTASGRANRCKARKIPSLRRTDEFWPWPLVTRDFLQPLWKLQCLFRIFRNGQEMRIKSECGSGHRQEYIDWLKKSRV